MLHIVSKATVQDAVRKTCVGIVDGNLKGIKRGGDGKGRHDLSKASVQKIDKMPIQEPWHGMLGSQIRCKAALAHLFYEQESEYSTSRGCSLCGATDANSRVYRGLFVCSGCDRILNADVNGAKGILLRCRSKYPRPQSVEGVEAFFDSAIGSEIGWPDSGDPGVNPVRVKSVATAYPPSMSRDGKTREPSGFSGESVN